MNIIQSIRALDINDMYILHLLKEGLLLTQISKTLRLSQAAITQRMHKMQYSLGVHILEKKGSYRVLTKSGRVVAEQVSSSLQILENLPCYDEVYQQVEKKTRGKYKKGGKHSCGFLGPGV